MPLTTEFLPRREVDLLAWAQNFDDRLQAGAVGGIYGLTAEQITEYHDVFVAFSDAWTAANQNTTRTPYAIQVKNDAKVLLIAKIREFVAYIQGNPATTNADRALLQITVPDVEPSPVPAPAFAPGISIVSAVGTQVEIRLHDVQNPENVRGKPAGVAGAAVLTAFGSAPPLLSDTSAWTWQGNTSRTTRTIDFAGQSSGTTAWITAAWYNAKAETGPMAQPMSVQIPGQLAAAQGEGLQFPEEMNEAA